MSRPKHVRGHSRREFLAQTAAAPAVFATVNGATNPADPSPAPFAPVKIPEWVFGITRMAFLSPSEVAKAANAGAQVIHTNVVWPYFPLKRNGGGLSKDDDRKLRDLVADCRRHGVRICLGLPPFPPVNLVKKHPDWRVQPTDADAAVKIEPREDNLGTRLGCNVGPWGNYLIEICAELVRDYGVDGFSFDGNYHPPICYCSACKSAYRRVLPARASLDDIAYREYLVWRGERLEDHYRGMQQALKNENPDAVLTSWTVNAGRYGHFLHSPRAMPTRLNLLFDLPMQEWWLDETNFGASVAPAFGVAYLRATTGGRPCAAEPYLMSRGNPYGTDSFPAHERLTRCLLAVTHGSVLAESLGWPGHDVARDFREIRLRDSYLQRTEAIPWAALLVSEQTRQFYAYKDIPDRFLPHVFGAFRATLEEHLPLVLINDWDLTVESLARFAVVVLPNAAALSDKQAAALRDYVQAGGGLVATAESSLCDELGRPRRDFALADIFGVSFLGRPKAPLERPKLDENFAVAIDENYWKQRTGAATLTWTDHPLTRDARLQELVPRRSVTFRGPLTLVGEPASGEVVARMKPEGWAKPAVPALVLRTVGKGRVAYFAAAVDAGLWSYAYPYQRRLLARALEWAAREPATVSVRAPLCVQATYFTQQADRMRRTIVHLFNGVNTAANHGLPAADVPLREEVIPIHGIEVRFAAPAPQRFRCEPGQRAVAVRRDGPTTVVTLPPLEIHAMLVAEA